MMTPVVLPLAATDNTGLVTAYSFCRLHNSPLHGVPASSRPQALPKHASLYI